ncbi:MAG: M48 family metalloprotease [Pirellulaceae bacterium]|nr:M48 family metalloprotease [Pirellulaceae bacterium]
MVSLRNFVLILLTLSCYELSFETPVLDLGQTVLAVMAMVLGFAVMTKTIAFRTFVGRQQSWGDADKEITGVQPTSGGQSLALLSYAFSQQRLRIERWWCAALPLTLVGTSWCAWAKSFERLGSPQSLCLLTCYLPTLLLWLFVEQIHAQVDEMCQPNGGQPWIKHWRLRIRLGEIAGLLTCLLPVLMLSSMSELSDLVAWSLGISSSLARALGGGLLLCTLFLVFPSLLTTWSGGQPLPEQVQQRIESIAKRTGTSGFQAVLIPSQGRWAGAAIVGWFPGFRRLWIGDALMEQLTSRQLDMVVLHELAHIRRLHFIWRALPVIWAMGTGAIIWLAGYQLDLVQHWSLKLACGLSASLILLIGLSSMARRCELDADRVACDLARKSVDWSASQSPAEVLGSALGQLLGESASQVSTWLHPSLNARLANLSVWRCSP